MRISIVVASLLGLAAASPCKPKSTKTVATSTSITSASPVSTSSGSTGSLVPTTTALSNIQSSSSTSVSSSLSSSSATTATSSNAVTTVSTTQSSSTVTSQISSSSAAPSSSSSLSSVLSTSSSSTSTSSTASSATSESTSSVVSTTSSKSTTPLTSSTITTTSSSSTSSVPSTTTHTTTSTSAFNPATASVTNAVALTFYDPSLTDGTAGRNPPSSGYECFAGPAINFPQQSTWVNFETMWQVLSRDEFAATGDTAVEIQSIRDAVVAVSQVAKVDARVILAVVMDESAGRVRVACTANGVPNCGLMQAYNSSSYNAADSANSIRLMIQDGTQGTQYGPGLVQLLNGSPLSSGSTQGNLWKSLRAYNSGSFDETNLSNGLGATPAYVSNIANYLQGWNGYGSGGENCNWSIPSNTQPNNP